MFWFVCVRWKWIHSRDMLFTPFSVKQKDQNQQKNKMRQTFATNSLSNLSSTLVRRCHRVELQKHFAFWKLCKRRHSKKKKWKMIAVVGVYDGWKFISFNVCACDFINGSLPSSFSTVHFNHHSYLLCKLISCLINESKQQRWEWRRSYHDGFSIAHAHQMCWVNSWNDFPF